MDHATFNVWFWMYLAIAPTLVFAAGANAGPGLRLGRLLAAILLCYLMLNAATHLTWDLRLQRVQANPAATEDEWAAATADGANLLFIGILGWIPASMYVALWEVVWRIHFRRALKAAGARQGFSNFLIGFAAFALLAFVGLMAISGLNVLWSYLRGLWS